MTISRALVDCADGGYVEKDTKTHAARRIALDASMVKSLRAHKQRQAERALMAESASMASYGSSPTSPMVRSRGGPTG